MRETRGRQVVTELVRLGVVLSFTAAGYALGGVADGVLDMESPETTRLVTSVLGALFGYLLGGVLGRALVRGVDTAAVRLEQVPAVQLVATAIGAALGAFAGLALLLPFLLLPYQQVTVPIALLVLVGLAYGGVASVRDAALNSAGSSASGVGSRCARRLVVGACGSSIRPRSSTGGSPRSRGWVS